MDETTQIERALEPMVREHGLESVREVLKPGLFSRTSDWQRWWNLAGNVAGRIEREAQ